MTTKARHLSGWARLWIVLTALSWLGGATEVIVMRHDLRRVPHFESITSGQLCADYADELFDATGEPLDKVETCLSQPNLFAAAHENRRASLAVWAQIALWFGAPIALFLLSIVGRWIQRGFRQQSN